MISLVKESMKLEDKLREIGSLNPDALIPEGLGDALVGYTVGAGATVAVYDYDLAVEVFRRDNKITAEEAEEFLSFNTIFAYYGENTPLFVRFQD